MANTPGESIKPRNDNHVKVPCSRVLHEPIECRSGILRATNAGVGGALNAKLTQRVYRITGDKSNKPTWSLIPTVLVSPLVHVFSSSRMFSIRSKGVSGTVGILLARTP